MADIELGDIDVFCAVVEHGGFTAAARVLGLPTSAVSRRIARLEERTGFQLLNRTTRRVAVTEAGRVFHARTKDLSGQVRDAVAAMSAAIEAPRGTLRVTAPPDHAGVIWALLEPFLTAYPEVDLDLTHTLERVDLLEQDIDVAIRGGSAPDTTVYTAHRIFDSRILLAASPAYLARRGTPQRAEDLADHDGVCMDPWAPNGLRRVQGDRAPVRIDLRNRLRANSLYTAQRAALAGLGIAPLLELTCRDELATGRLVEVLRGALPDHAPMWVLAPLGRTRSAAATALVETIRRTAATLAKG
jgi:LysR family transcriptional regulator AphB